MPSRISVKEFASSLRGVWHPRRRLRNGAHTLGLAVSGGSDSMALAFLCSQLQHGSRVVDNDLGRGWDNRSLRFVAFVVDHKAREESTEEAQQVRYNLEKLKIPAEILTLDWYSKTPASQLSNFETRARKLRYQALGLACKRHDIDSLLLGHHRDDQAETILERLVGGYTGAGLVGMKDMARIPECQGMAGVSEFMDDEGLESAPLSPRKRDIRPAVLGITIHRPLLQYPKARLVQTCCDNDVSWVEDKTNIKETVTVRNTIRHLLSKGKLPIALRQERALDLKKRTTKTLERVNAKASEVKGKFPVKEVDLSTGSVRCQLPVAQLLRNAVLDRTDQKDPEALISQEAVFTWIQNVIRMVSPIPNFRKGLGFDKISELSLKHKSTIAETLVIRPSEHAAPLEVFHISRSIPRRTSVPHCQWTWASNRSGQRADVWQLWDNRFWIRVSLRKPTTVICQPLKPEHLAQFRKSAAPRRKRQLGRLLRDRAEAHVRFTLPALLEARSGSLLALPTIDFQSDGCAEMLDYEVRFKAFVGPELETNAGVSIE